MIFILEDDPCLPTSKAFMKAVEYCNEYRSARRLNPIKTVYTYGNGNLHKHMLETCAEFPGEAVIVFMDLIPDNAKTVSVYTTLVEAVQKHCLNAIVVPMLSAEFYLAKSFALKRSAAADSLLEEVAAYSTDPSWTSNLLYCGKKNYEKVTKACLDRLDEYCIEICSDYIMCDFDRNFDYESCCMYRCSPSFLLRCCEAEGCRFLTLREKHIMNIETWPLLSRLYVSDVQKITREHWLLEEVYKLCVEHNDRVSGYTLNGRKNAVIRCVPIEAKYFPVLGNAHALNAYAESCEVSSSAVLSKLDFNEEYSNRG